MTTTLDLDRLLQTGHITPEEHARLERLSSRATRTLAVRVLAGFGAVAVAAGIFLLAIPFPPVAILVGGLFIAMRLALHDTTWHRWPALGAAFMVVGCLLAGGGVLLVVDGGPRVFAGVGLAFLVASVIAPSGLLAGIAAVTLFPAVQGAFGYVHALYWVSVAQPTLTIGVFTMAALSSYLCTGLVDREGQGPLLVFSRTCVVIVNLGFWVGSLWGDWLWVGRASRTAPPIPDLVFVVGWALALVAAGTWAALAHRRWLVNAVAVFGAIHFYTQYFERLGASPSTLIGAGVVAVALATGLTYYNWGNDTGARELP